MAYCVSGVVIYPHSIPESLEWPVTVRYGNRQNRDFVSSTGIDIGPETMIHSPNCFTLPCVGPFHKIHAGYEATTTTLS